jgi:DNA-binding MarR family transcriptional regulator
MLVDFKNKEVQELKVPHLIVLYALKNKSSEYMLNIAKEYNISVYTMSKTCARLSSTGYHNNRTKGLGYIESKVYGRTRELNLTEKGKALVDKIFLN